MDPATILSFITTATLIPVLFFAGALFFALRVSVSALLTIALSVTLSWAVLKTAPLSELIPFVPSSILEGNSVWFFIILSTILFFFLRGAFGESFDGPGFVQGVMVSLGVTVLFLGIFSNVPEFHTWYTPPAFVTALLSAPAYHVWAIVTGWALLSFGRDRI